MGHNSLLAAQLKAAFLAGIKSTASFGPYVVASYRFNNAEDAAAAYVADVTGGNVLTWGPWLVAASRLMIEKHQRPNVPIDLYQAQHTLGRSPEEAVVAIDQWYQQQQTEAMRG